ncbi:MAG TPA: RHS repeat-associated core domain-containing protein [Cyclobacteriaceae bacterium]|nr:RHS repeat-associated core domain-containing protein [Cyclobacteriaceae bacterium]
MKRYIFLILVFCCIAPLVSSAQEITIPAALVTDPTSKRPIPLDGTPAQYALTSLAANSTFNVFSCTGGNYYVGFQLVYELGDTQTLNDWNVDLSIDLLNSGAKVWAAPKVLSIKMTRNDPVYLATVFHDVSIACSANYTFKIVTKSLGTGTVPPQANIYLKVLLHKIEDPFNQAATLNFNVVNGNDESFLTWAFGTASDEKSIMGYDVEWVFIDNYELVGTSFATNADAFKFKEPVRITTTAKNYTHSTFYPSGKIWYRVRSVGYDPAYPDHRIPGNTWTYFSPIILSNRQGDMNWQTQSVFAEEGKYKKVVSFYDGTLRSRQALTNLSSEDITIAGETRYDYEGRKSIDILPVPLIAWQNLVLTLADGGTVTKSYTAATGWNAGSTSVEQMPANVDGFAQVKVDEITSLRAFGLSVNSSNQTYTAIKYALYLNGSTVSVYENGALVAGTSQTIKVNDILTVLRTGTTVVYKLNNQTIYTSTLASTTALYTATAMSTPGAKIVVVGGMPTPPMKFVPGLNPFLTQDGTNTVAPNTLGTRTKFHYDNGTLVNSIVNSTGGAGKYYSSSNPGLSKDYIPDAEGFVYSQIEYTNDGTGRVKRQSGVGKEFRLDGSGRPVQTYYGNATPAELIRLFGTNVGNVTHYKKNLVVDPNSQASVSYLDQEGRVVATALAGINPVNLEILPKNIGTGTVSVDISSENVKGSGVSKTVHKILNTAVNTLYNFNYKLTSQSWTPSYGGCVTCTYDLKITITDPNGALVNINSPTVISGNQATDVYSYLRTGLSPACALTTLVDITFPVTLGNLGDYTVTKTLTPSEYTYDLAKTQVLKDPAVTAKINAMTTAFNDPAALSDDIDNCTICTTLPTTSTLSDIVVDVADQECNNLYQIISDELVTDGIPVTLQNVIARAGKGCKYNLYCIIDKQSEVFDKQLALVTTWTEAVAKGYNNLATVTTTSDPFFAVGASGNSYIAQMQTALNNITLPNIQFDSNSDGIPDKSFKGSILNITDPSPTNTAFYINYNGQNAVGYHVLYYDLMIKKASMTTADYNAAIDKQRWTLFKMFYLEAKRNLKLNNVPQYSASNCALVNSELSNQSTQGLALNGDPYQNQPTVNAWGATSPYYWKSNVSDPELLSALYSIRWACGIKSFTTADSTSIWSNLTTYFNSDPNNFFHIIMTKDLATNSNLIAVNSILANYNGCSLSGVALADPVSCTTKAGSDLIPLSVNNGNISASCTSDQSLTVTLPDLTKQLQVGKTYRIRFAYLPGTNYINGAGGDLVPTTPSPFVGKVFLDFAHGSGATMAARSTCSTPRVPITIDPIYIGSANTTSNQAWIGTGLNNKVYNYISIDFRPTQVSNTFVFSMANVSGDYQSVTLKDITLAEVVSGESPDFNVPAVCTAYDNTNTTLSQWNANVAKAFSDAIQNCQIKAAAERTILIGYATDNIIDDETSKLLNTQRTNCLSNAVETTSFSFDSREYQYTLYYYDQAGELVQTVPPEGVNPLNNTQVTQFLAGTKTSPAHTLITRYQYNSLNQLILQTTPDAGKSTFYYNTKGQLKFSQNAQQFIDNNYSYSKYDNQGRVIEVGELNVIQPDNLATLLNNIDNINFPVATATLVLNDVTHTYYDFADATPPSYPPGNGPFLQEYLRNRVSYVEVYDKGAAANDITATYYSYDIHGNVKSLLQQITGLENKRTDYRYDLISGKVNYVLYQYANSDQLIHQYKYDADNRLTEVLTSTDGYIWDSEARYKYYLHGPLARIELGQYRVQGLDYYYTLQGWLKGVNMPTGQALLPATSVPPDPSKDGYNGINLRAARDVFAFTLGYYNGDYKPANSGVVLADTRDQMWTRYGEVMGTANTGLYNGNIAWMITDLKKIGQINAARVKGVQAMLYKYDQLNRIIKDRSLTYTATGFTPRTTVATANYDEDFSYDGNGNILSLVRRDNANTVLDNYAYTYYPNSNKLQYVKPLSQFPDKTFSGAIATDNRIYKNIIVDATAYVPAGTSATIKAINNISFSNNFNSSTTTNKSLHAYVLGTSEGTYNYDAIGNIVADQEAFAHITWTPYGKVRSVTKDDGTVMTFRYDGAGNRVEKKVVFNSITTITRYVRDASGNVMGVYNGTTLSEQSIYGSSRLGLYRGDRSKGTRRLGSKFFELSNHLGNVLSIITDNVNMTVDSTWANVVNASDYYAFGSTMPGRTYDASATYRYGFNGKEKDADAEWGSTEYDYGFRIYNPKIGKFLSVDPLTKSYPWYTPYQFAGNMPIVAIDLDGLEEKVTIKPHVAIGAAATVVTKETSEYVLEKTISNIAIDASGKLIKVGGRSLKFIGGTAAAIVVFVFTPVNGGDEDPSIASHSAFQQEQMEQYQLDHLERRLQESGHLSEWEENKYIELMAKIKGIYLEKGDIFNKLDKPYGTYDDSNYSKHGSKKVGNISAKPINGQEALDGSYLVKQKREGFSQRVSVEGDHFVVLDEQEPGKFHGHQRTWKELSHDQRNTLIENEITDIKGKILNK